MSFKLPYSNQTNWGGLVLVGPTAAPAVVPDPYFEYTTLLLPGNGTNGAQNNTFLDSSTNNFTITRNGNTTQGTFSPFSQTGWGNYFDGSGDYLTSAINAIPSGSTPFTVETWIYPTAFSGTSTIFGGVTNIAEIQFSSGGVSYNKAGVAVILSSSTALTLNAWNHIAVVRNGTNNSSILLNGVRLTTTASDSNTFSATTSYIGSGGATQYCFGYLSNFRFVVGTAVYDPTQTTYTVPTAPLTAISGTSLLTCQSNRFIDNSTNNFTITVNGNTSVVAFSPFNPTASWSAAANGGSGYFDGSGDSLTIASQAALGFGTGDFCVDFWAYRLNTTNFVEIFKLNEYNTGLFIRAESPTYSDSFYFMGGGYNWDPGTNFKPFAWAHICVTRQSGTLRFFVNGKLIVNATNTSNMGSAYANISSGSYLGYQSAISVIKGSVPAAFQTSITTVGTQVFSPPTSPPTIDANTSLLMNFSNAGVYDATSKNDLETVGNAQISTAQFQFAPSSMAFDGNGDYLIMPDAQTGQFLTGDFTVEYWCRFGSQGTNYAPQVGTLSSASPSGTWRFGTFTNNGGVYLAYHNGSTYVDVQFGSTAYNDNTWRHFALTRSGTTVRAFVNGTQVGTNQTVSQNFNSSNKVCVGAELTNPTYFNGYIQDLRITKGYARYTANFTPPTAAFPTL